MGDNKKVRCDWCCGSSILNVGPGYFRDTDSDTSYGIPVCGGCGGLGFGFMDSADYKERRERIFTLRFTYCPVDDLPSPNAGMRLKTLRQLEREVKELYELYGDNQPCFAQSIAQGGLALTIASLERSIDERIAMYREQTPRVDPGIIEPLRAALIATVKGDIDEADRLFREVMRLRPEDSVVRHDYAVFAITCLRNAERALPHFQAACELEPKCARHFVSTFRCLFLLKRPDAAIEYLRLASSCPDVDELGPDLQDLLRQSQDLPTSETH